MFTYILLTYLIIGSMIGALSVISAFWDRPSEFKKMETHLIFLVIALLWLLILPLAYKHYKKAKSN